ncbi:MAG: hypothetical protein ACI37T_06340 [Candidatus Gastranaerophilaceae bacterium]
MSSNNQVIYPIEKIVAVLSYYSFGLAGLIYLIIALIQKQGLRPFLRYHVFMSIFISILIYIISMALIFVINILEFIPFVKAVVFAITTMFQVVFFSFWIFQFSISSLLITGLITYLAVGAIMGKYTYLPWVSEIINYNLRQ